VKELKGSRLLCHSQFSFHWMQHVASNTAGLACSRAATYALLETFTAITAGTTNKSTAAHPRIKKLHAATCGEMPLPLQMDGVISHGGWRQASRHGSRAGIASRLRKYHKGHSAEISFLFPLLQPSALFICYRDLLMCRWRSAPHVPLRGCNHCDNDKPLLVSDRVYVSLILPQLTYSNADC
jgi:hypothetical protein